MSISHEPAFDVLTSVETSEDLRRCLQIHPELQSIQSVEKLHSEIVSGIVVDVVRARRLATVARWIAEALDDEYARGLADRSEGHVHYAAANYPAALRAYECAAARFEQINRDVDVAKTLTGAMQTLLYLGREDTALTFAARARAVFEREGDHLRLARLDSNVGNIFFRKDQYAEAVTFYRRASSRLGALNRGQDLAAVLCNMAVALTGLGEFDEAASTYVEARNIAGREAMRELAAEVDYNYAYLYFLRGDYAHALELYKDARKHSHSIGDAYHAALCDLDQAEVYLNLNLVDESLQLAEQAAAGFERIGMNYERAKALTYCAICEHRRLNVCRALFLFGSAKRFFVESQNAVWSATIDLYRAILLRDLGRRRVALKLGRRASAVFSSERLPARRGLVELFLTEIYLDGKDFDRALTAVESVIETLKPSDHPLVLFHAEYLKGRILRASGDLQQAYAALISAADLLESIRCRLASDVFKVAFVENKLNVYADLMLLAHKLLPESERGPAMLDFVERSKSRSLADHLASLDATCEGSALSPEVARLRQELNALYRELDSRESERRDTSTVWGRILEHEQRLKGFIADVSIDFKPKAGITDWTPVPPEVLGKALSADTRMVEYFVAGDRVWAAVIGGDCLEFKELGDVDPIDSASAFLILQMSKGQYQPAALATPAKNASIMAHLQRLYRSLIEPIEPWIDCENLVIVPHGLLHRLPFHAFHNGSSFLIDNSTISYAPSATVFSLCERRSVAAAPRSLVIGAIDENNPAIVREVENVRHFLPDAAVFLGGEAAEKALFEEAGNCRYVHIATHAEFRADDSVFSSIRLNDTRINTFDLCRLKLNAELVTLSGCSTGLGAASGSDELIGLARGLMHAGARAVLLSLWNVHDASTEQFMTSFYQNIAAGATAARALQHAVTFLRENWTAPYYWAPFFISGYALAAGAK